MSDNCYIYTKQKSDSQDALTYNNLEQLVRKSYSKFLLEKNKIPELKKQTTCDGKLFETQMTKKKILISIT